MKAFLRFLTLVALAGPALAADNGPFNPARVEVYYSPSGGCTEACVAVLDGAKKTIYVQAYSFTSAPIAQALVDAKKRGVAIQVILDKSQRSEKYTEADFISRAGIPTFIDAKHAIAHNKVMIVDGSIVITGSFNFTKAAESNNAENMLVIHGKPLAARYFENWEEHLAHSEVYTPRGDAPAQPLPAPLSTTIPIIGDAPTPAHPRTSLSVAKEWTNFGAYLQTLAEKATVNLQKTIDSHGLNLPHGTSVRVTFTLAADGSVKVQWMGATGADVATTKIAGPACERSVIAGAPYAPWTPQMIQTLGTGQMVTLAFTF